MFFVYKHTCPNGKVYIGITMRKPEYRWNKGKGYKNNKHFYNAIKKYDWNNIEHKILFENLSKEEAEKKEIELISQYKSNNAKYGYNIEYGGCHNGKTSESTKEKIRQANLGKKLTQKHIEILRQANIGRKMTDETKKKISQANSGKKLSESQKKKISNANKGKTAWNKGKHTQNSGSFKKGHKVSKKTIDSVVKAHKGKSINEETRRKMSEAQKGEKCYWYGKKIPKEITIKIAEKHKKKVYCYETNKIYTSIQSAENELKIHHISDVCNNKIKHSKGYHFRFV